MVYIKYTYSTGHFKHFKDRFPSINIGFSKFAEMRPKHCILAGQSGTHTVCVCTTHQNVKLMIENAKLNTITNGNLTNYKQCLAKVLCNPSSIDCNTGNCVYCPGDTEIRTILLESFDEHFIEQVQFRPSGFQLIILTKRCYRNLQKNLLIYFAASCHLWFSMTSLPSNREHSLTIQKKI